MSTAGNVKEKNGLTLSFNQLAIKKTSKVAIGFEFWLVCYPKNLGSITKFWIHISLWTFCCRTLSEYVKAKAPFESIRSCGIA